MKTGTASLATAITALSVSSSVCADEYQQLTPTAVYTSGTTTYIVFPQNVGFHGCTIDRNSVAITAAEHSAEMVKSSLAVALAAIASGTNLTVFWSGCMANGRPKATLVGLGSTQVN